MYLSICCPTISVNTVEVSWGFEAASYMARAVLSEFSNGKSQIIIEWSKQPSVSSLTTLFYAKLGITPSAYVLPECFRHRNNQQYDLFFILIGC